MSAEAAAAKSEEVPKGAEAERTKTWKKRGKKKTSNWRDTLDFMREYDIQSIEEFERHWITGCTPEERAMIDSEIFSLGHCFQDHYLDSIIESICMLWDAVKRRERDRPGAPKIRTLREAEDEFDVFNFKALK